MEATCSPAEDFTQLVVAMVQCEFHVTARPFQTSAITVLACQHRRLLVVAPTAGGKSLCGLGSIKMLHGVGFFFEPLLSVGFNQASSAAKAGLRAFHWESLAPASRVLLIKKLKAVKRRSDATILIFLSPVSAQKRDLAAVVSLLVKRGGLSLTVFDEAYRIVKDTYRDFKSLEKSIVRKINRSVLPVAVLVMTATWTKKLDDDLKVALPSLNLTDSIWSDVNRRGIKLLRAVEL